MEKIIYMNTEKSITIKQVSKLKSSTILYSSNKFFNFDSNYKVSIDENDPDKLIIKKVIKGSKVYVMSGHPTVMYLNSTTNNKTLGRFEINTEESTDEELVIYLIHKL